MRISDWSSDVCSSDLAVEGLDEASLLQRRDALRKRRERLVNDRLGLVGEIAQLEERAKTLGGAGPATRAAAAAELAEAAAAAHDRLKEEAEMLSLLAETIRNAQRETARRFLAPITPRVAPFLDSLLPHARSDARRGGEWGGRTCRS